MIYFFHDTATTEIYTLSLHDALPISGHVLDLGRRVEQVEHRLEIDEALADRPVYPAEHVERPKELGEQDRKSTRLNSSHGYISYAVFCLKKKTNKHK